MRLAVRAFMSILYLCEKKIAAELIVMAPGNHW